MSWGGAWLGQFLAVQAKVKRITPAGMALIDDATASDQLTTLGVSAYIQTLVDDADAVAALATLGVVASTYTPTLTNVSNVAASTAHLVPYIRVGSVVAVGVYCEIDPSLAAPTITTMGISLPIASSFANAREAMGSAVSFSSANIADRIIADTTNDRAELGFVAGSGANAVHTGSFFYRII